MGQELCSEAGIEVVPKLAFEKWRFAAKWKEDTEHGESAAAGNLLIHAKKAKARGDPLLPHSGSSRPGAQLVEEGLVDDLVKRCVVLIPQVKQTVGMARCQ